MFTVKGIINNKEFYITWDKAKLSGDKEAIEKAVEENKKEHGWLGIGAEQENKKYLNYEYPAHHLIVKYVFDRITEETDDLPETKEGAIY